MVVWLSSWSFRVPVSSEFTEQWESWWEYTSSITRFLFELWPLCFTAHWQLLPLFPRLLLCPFGVWRHPLAKIQSNSSHAARRCVCAWVGGRLNISSVNFKYFMRWCQRQKPHALLSSTPQAAPLFMPSDDLFKGHLSSLCAPHTKY